MKFINMNKSKIPSPLKMGTSTGGTYSNQQNIRGSQLLPFIPVVGAGAHPDLENFKVFCNDVYVREQHLTVIKRGPTMPPRLELYSWDTWDENTNTGIEDTSGDDNIKLTQDFYGPQVGHFSGTYSNYSIDGENITTFYNHYKELKTVGDLVMIQIDLTGTGPDWVYGTKLIIKYSYTNSLGVIQTASFRCQIEIIDAGSPFSATIYVKLLSIPFNFPLYPNLSQIFTATAIKKDIIFEYKFPKFAYRYQYDDGEYSVFSPWSEIAFIPGKFDYLPKKGYNLGMTNNLRTLKVKNWRPKNIPKDVIGVDLLYKESNSPNIYTVESFDINDKINEPWNLPGTGNHFGDYTVSSEIIHQVVASNQLLRPWDNVPRMALGQEITANRLIYANYLQNYNLVDPLYKDESVDSSKYIKPIFSISTEIVDHSIDSDDYEANPMNLSLYGSKNQPKFPMKSLKSMRTYQLGVVYRDRYGRETPVLTSDSGSIIIPKASAKLQSRLAVQLQNSAPDWAESYTFYIKEASNEYYNLSLDRWYDAEDGGIWLAFPSSERNKIDKGSIIILKKQHGNDKPVETNIKYKIIDIKDNAPSSIKTDIQYWGVIAMMLPPPGWGVGGKVGGWDSGMFHPTGLPLPDRLYLDIYAEYFDQSVLAGLSNKSGAQIRMIQSPGLASSYTAWSSAYINKSNWYDVSNVNHIGAPEQVYSETSEDQYGNDVTVIKEIPGQAEQLVRITLEKLMGEDMAFCKPIDDLSLNRGLSLEARTKTHVDRARFHGRFFAKIHRDVDTDINIVYPQQKVSTEYQVLMAKEIKYLCFGHPGIQDWRTDAINTFGNDNSSHGIWFKGGFHHNSYLNNVSFNYLPPAFDPALSPNEKKYHHTDGIFPTPPFNNIKREVSSFSATVGPTGTFTGEFPLHGGGAPVNPSPSSTTPPPQNAPYFWPIGPGWHASNVYGSNSPWPAYANTYSNFSYGDGSNTPEWPPAAKNNHGWPAFSPDHWAPNSTIDVNWASGGVFPNTNFVSSSSTPTIQGQTLPYFNSAEWNAGLQIKENDQGSIAASMKEIPPANPYQVPAIWGNQEDFFDNPLLHADLAAGTNNTQNDSFWDSGTIDKLSKQWKNFFWGRRDVDSNWPPCHTSTERWFFDKVGAAKGYSGNGIWEEDNVSKMHISFFGIGNSYSGRHRSHEMVTHQENEIPFAEALSTVGTQFRFRSDPDQTVYSVTRVEGPELIYNYETPRGTWAYEEDGTTPIGGSGIGTELLPPFGPTYQGGSGGVANKQAFISDVFKDKAELKEENTGGAPYNYRTRYTLTLDKIVGAGASGFHPILKHVDDIGDCNIEMGPKVYWSGTSGSAPPSWKGNYNPSVEIGGTILPVAMYNLHSYWNYDTTATPNTPPAIEQSGTAGVGDDPATNMRFGLHEAGLNGTWLEIVTPYTEEEIEDTVSTNPAVFETEPKEDIGLDIYYAASPTYPINLKRWRSDRLVPDPIDYHWTTPSPPLLSGETGAYYHDYSWRGEEMIPIGATVKLISSTNGSSLNPASVISVQEDTVWLNNVVKGDATGAPLKLIFGDKLRISWVNEGAFYGGKSDDMYIDITVDSSIDYYTAKLAPITHNSTHVIPYFNCYTFANGVESNRIRDDYNAVTIDKGVKASMPLAEKYLEERRGSSLIFSGIYNSTSGINRTNQFIQAEPITKEINPINGTIQKLFARDTDLITICENKVFKILANKDALFSAGGDVNLTSTTKVLGQVVPFVGDYGISKNPESFASESYRVYFADKNRGTILRLSRDGLTPISDYGMKDWFKDNLMFATSIIGSYDDAKSQYNITLETKDRDDNKQAYTLSYVEKKRGWESFKSWVHQGGISHKNVYYTFPSNNYYYTSKLDNWGISYMPTNILGWAETFEHNLDLITKRYPLINYNTGTTTIVLNASFDGVIIVGMNVEGNGIPYGTTVIDINYGGNSVTLNNTVFVSTNNELTFTIARNWFYHIPNHYSMLKVLFNGQQGSVKRFKTLNYEGSQARVQIEDITTPDIYNLYGVPGDSVTLPVYYDNWDKKGWYVENLLTDCQKGNINEFIEKECKWFNYIRGYEDSGAKDLIDTAQYSSQGLGFISEPDPPSGRDVYGCTNLTALNYNPLATIDDGSCTYGCPALDQYKTDNTLFTAGNGYSVEILNEDPAGSGSCEIINATIVVLIPGFNPGSSVWQWEIFDPNGISLPAHLFDWGTTPGSPISSNNTSNQSFDNTITLNNFDVLGGSGTYTVKITHTTGGVVNPKTIEYCSFDFTVDCERPCYGFPAGSANPFNLSFCATDTTSPTSGNGYINLTITGGSGQFAFAWSNGAITQNVSNLNMGPITVTVTDTCTGQTAISDFISFYGFFPIMVNDPPNTNCVNATSSLP